MNAPDVTAFLRDFHAAMELAKQVGDEQATPLREALEPHFGRPVSDVPVVSEPVPNHRFADWDVALAMLAERDPEQTAIGVGGAEMRYHQAFADYIGDRYGRFPVGQVDYVSLPVSAREYRRVIGLGVRVFRYRDTPVAVLQRRANPRFGDQNGAIELMCADPEVGAQLLDEARELAITHSVLRGNLITFEETGYGPQAEKVSFLERPEVTADEVILPGESLERIVGHVVGVAEHAELLRQHGQHLKRGLLLYGPPGTGKTHTVRHLVTRCPQHTVVVLAGAALKFVHHAAGLARALQPAIVVLEDCDLVADDRSLGAGPKPLLFEVLDTMDGMDADADVTFLLTTNRIETLERALAQRPGRVDLAVEIPLPDAEGRRRLLELYRGDVAYSEAALAAAARSTDGMTASFMKELMRRAVLGAAVLGQEPADAHLSVALDELLAQDEQMTRVLLGGPGSSSNGASPGGFDPGCGGYV